MIPSDRRLIRQYLKHNEQFAFEQLVCHHSEMVMKVCRNMLSQSTDADDAFQATFLILARKVHTLQDRSSIAGWLYEVAIRNCLQVRQRRRRSRETDLPDESAAQDAGSGKRNSRKSEPWQILAQSEEARVVLAEINQLPSKYREVIVLCCVDEHSRRSTANLLNTTEATVKGLLARGRSLLKSRLVKRGIAPAAALSVSQTDSCLGGTIDIHPNLMESTLRIFAAPLQEDLADSNSFASTVAAESLRQMAFTTRAKLLTAIVAALLVLVAVPLAVLAQKPDQPSESVAVTKLQTSETDYVTEVTGTTFYERFQKISPALFDRNAPSVITKSFSGAVTDSNGKPVSSAIVVLRVLIGIDSDGGKYNGIIAKTITDSTGSYSFKDISHLRKHGMLEIVAATEEGSLGWKNFFPKQAKPVQNIALSKTTPVRGRIVDEKGFAVNSAKVTLGIVNPRAGNGSRIMSTGYYRRLSSPEVQTNAEGYFEFPTMPKNVSLRLLANHPDFAVSQFLDVDTFDIPAGTSDFELKAGVEFSGKVVDQDGNAVVGAEICFPGRVFRSGDDGTFSFSHVEKPKGDGIVHFTARHPEFGVTSQRVKGHKLKTGTAIIKVINLSQLAEIRGRVVANNDGQPVSEVLVTSFDTQQKFNSVSTYVNDDGEFVLKGLSPGKWSLRLGKRVPGFDLRHEDCIIREVTLKPKESKEINFSVPRIDPIEVRVLDQKGQPVVGAEVRSGSYYRSLFREDWPVTDMNGSASLLPELKPDSSTILIAKWKNKGKVYWAQRYWSTQSSADELVLKPAATLQGKVSAAGKPIVGANVRVGFRQHSIFVTEGNMTTAMPITRSFDTVETDSRGVYSLQVPTANPDANHPVYMLTLLRSSQIPNPDVGNRTEPANFNGTEFIKDFDLVKGEGKVSGTVVDGQGNPVPNVLVSVIRLFSPATGQEVHPTRLYLPSEIETDDQGQFAIEGLPVGATVSVGTRHTKASDLKKFGKSAYRTTKDIVIGAKTETKFVLQSITTQR